ncbi:TPA: BppU family phage baseplate upper protein [Bacillus anthracis]|nr:BppU family phage baseplate upper protein [Bacillus cereus biovar anthracis]HDR6237676.1 BppU family phage baseplate upper protein [Bacillus cereus biovar anthracis]HDR6248835.1 BppU family phage baseplate upper protein [Bacillus cereus biovar anthracis]
MTFKTYEINVDLVNDTSTTSSNRFSQNDRNSAKFVLNITNEGRELDLSQAKSVRMSFKKPDGTRVFQNDCQPINAMKGKYQIVLKTQTLTSVGNVIAQIHIEEEDRILDTQKFFFVVNDSLASDEAIESTNEFTIIQKAIEAGKKLEGVDINGIIDAGVKAEGAVKKTGDTMTGHLDLDVTITTKSIRSTSSGNRQSGIFFDPNGDLGAYDWGNPDGGTALFRYTRASKSFDITAPTTNLVRKAEVFTDIAKPNGDAAISIQTGQDMLAEVIKLGRGIRTIYAPGSALNSPSDKVFRGIANLQGTSYGYIIGVSSDNKVWSNFINGSTWSGWVCANGNIKDGQATLTLTDNAAQYGTTYTPIAIRRGNTVTIRMAITRNSNASGILTTLPSDMRPKNGWISTIISTDGMPSDLTIRVNGEVEVLTKSKTFYITLTYVVD